MESESYEEIPEDGIMCKAIKNRQTRNPIWFGAVVLSLLMLFGILILGRNTLSAKLSFVDYPIYFGIP